MDKVPVERIIGLGSVPLVAIAVVLVLNSVTAMATSLSVRRLQEDLRWTIMVTAQAGNRGVADRGARNIALPGPLRVEMFSDFACAYCIAMVPALDSVRAHFGDRVEWKYRHLPRRPTESKASMRAAMIGVCTESDGGPWVMLRRVYSSGAALDADLLEVLEYRDLGDRVASCVGHPETESRVWSDIVDASRRGITATPTFEALGVRLTGQLTAAQLIDFTDAQLAKTVSP